jgi:HAD superfamily hydrolase (TIGR01509 family)
MPVDLVIFDCDGVLVDSEGIVNEVESALLRELGIELGPEQARARFQGRTLVQNLKSVEELIGGPMPAHWPYLLAMRTAAEFVKQLRAVPGVESVLSVLAEREQPICVASQSSLPRVELSLRVARLSDFFGQSVFTASMVQRGKPFPDLFLFAAARLGVAPERAVVIEDSPSGVAAARAAGMRVFGYTAGAAPGPLERAGAVPFDHMDQLIALLDGAG